MTPSFVTGNASISNARNCQNLISISKFISWVEQNCTDPIGMLLASHIAELSELVKDNREVMEHGFKLEI